MTLAAEVQSRYSVQQLKNWTNPLNPSATIVNTTLLNLACTDVTADFLNMAELAFDVANAEHLSVAVEGVVMKLRMWAGQLPDETARLDLWGKRLKSLRDTGPRRRVDPVTNSLLTPTVDDTSRGPVRPAFDKSVFEPLIPGAPKSANLDEDHFP
jgi:hypothetical protein